MQMDHVDTKVCYIVCVLVVFVSMKYTGIYGVDLIANIKNNTPTTSTTTFPIQVSFLLIV